ncbi:hypothetical protein CYMTET_37696 [Cymbomonas tetramitiformis]|uniref:Uncharacterized protein n=1 Tax=Cymbomonas tetramitiformis TaxID=36881 RepID=A0AAE0CFS7_9CHLO|nr:hypothetical protein CYMTET_37696 [Cymbomonas tetramitiformis]
MEVAYSIFCAGSAKQFASLLSSWIPTISCQKETKGILSCLAERLIADGGSDNKLIQFLIDWCITIAKLWQLMDNNAQNMQRPIAGITTEPKTTFKRRSVRAYDNRGARGTQHRRSSLAQILAQGRAPPLAQVREEVVPIIEEGC